MWNISYEELIRLELETDVIMIAYADDVMLVVSAKTTEELETTANDSIFRVNQMIKKRQP